MASGATVAVLGTLAGSIAGATITGVINHYNTQLQQDEQNKRQRAEFYLDKKVEYLSRLYDALLRCDNIVHGQSRTHDEQKEMWEKYAEERRESEIQEAFKELEIAVRRGSIFLDDEDARVMSSTMMTVGALFQEMGGIGDPGVNEEHWIMENFREDMNEAKESLRQEINSPVNEIV